MQECDSFRKVPGRKIIPAYREHWKQGYIGRSTDRQLRSERTRLHTNPLRASSLLVYRFLVCCKSGEGVSTTDLLETLLSTSSRKTCNWLTWALGRGTLSLPKLLNDLMRFVSFYYVTARKVHVLA